MVQLYCMEDVVRVSGKWEYRALGSLVAGTLHQTPRFVTKIAPLLLVKGVKKKYTFSDFVWLPFSLFCLICGSQTVTFLL